MVTPDLLSPIEREQVVACVRRCFGTKGPLTVEELFASDRDRGADEAEFADLSVEWWDDEA